MTNTLNPDGLQRAYEVAKRRLGTRRSTTVQEIICAYLNAPIRQFEDWLIQDAFWDVHTTHEFLRHLEEAGFEVRRVDQ